MTMQEVVDLLRDEHGWSDSVSNLSKDVYKRQIHADADDFQGFRLGALLQIPVHCRGLSVAHGGDHRGHGAAGDGPQAK